jgi:hypothetical protein
MWIRTLIAMSCFAAALPVLATPQQRDATDMWFDPAESGWGLNLIHQGETLFGTLFVYGLDGQPKWYVASDLSGGPDAYSGTLRECTGPWFGGAFDTAAHSCRDVGSMRFTLGTTAGTVDYTAEGIHVVKQVQRFSFRRTTLQGGYEGYMLQPASGGTAESGKDDLTLHIMADDGSSFLMDSSSDSQSPCTWRGTPAQDGQYESVAGTFSCTGGSRTGSWSMKVDPTTEGFSGTFSGDGVTGRIAAARSTGSVNMYGSGWRNDMWFLPGESGWGLNVIEQGDTLFATLFVYDAQRRPRWYVASSLTQQGGSADGTATYSGALRESTGPYFGGPFDPAAVTPRQVGTMSFRARADGTGDLSYTVDAVTVAKPVRRFAFRKQDFSGSYLGSYAHDRQARITIDDSGPDFRMQLVDLFGGIGACNFVAPYEQLGSLRRMAGTFSCSSHTGSFLMQEATVSASGFTARFDTPNSTFDFRTITDGHLGGVRR